ncbi:MAG: hypothetical protein JOZ29_01420 [Deltaproteobacteria bacterium]|nr:hypothetical protein [Deltaproteobacteria bacterium]
MIAKLPGEFFINYLNGKPDTLKTCESLNEAIEIAAAMAKEDRAATARAAANYRVKRRLSMRPKAVIKRRIKAHNRRLRARALKAQRNDNRPL